MITPNNSWELLSRSQGLSDTVPVILTRPSKTHVSCQDVPTRYLRRTDRYLTICVRLNQECFVSFQATSRVKKCELLLSLSWHHQLSIVSQKATINNTYDTKDKTTDLILSLLPQKKEQQN